MEDEEELIEHYFGNVQPDICDYEDSLPRQGPKAKEEIKKKDFYAIMTFEKPVVSTPVGSLLIGSRLDAEIAQKDCRLAFSGRILGLIDKDSDLSEF